MAVDDSINAIKRWLFIDLKACLASKSSISALNAHKSSVDIFVAKSVSC